MRRLLAVLLLLVSFGGVLAQNKKNDATNTPWAVYYSDETTTIYCPTDSFDYHDERCKAVRAQTNYWYNWTVKIGPNTSDSDLVTILRNPLSYMPIHVQAARDEILIRTLSRLPLWSGWSSYCYGVGDCMENQRYHYLNAEGSRAWTSDETPKITGILTWKSTLSNTATMN